MQGLFSVVCWSFPEGIEKALHLSKLDGSAQPRIELWLLTLDVA